MLATRLSDSFIAPPLGCVSRNAILVRIYPQKGIGEPIELSASHLTIGREGCDLNLSDDSVSRCHAALSWDGSSHVLCDLRSTNGTFVNEQRITSVRLQIGDRIRFGKQIFKYLGETDLEAQYHDVVYKIMTTDGLTQVYNKSYLLEALQRELECSKRDSSIVSVMLMDLDKFKSINDTHGHLAGDKVLAEFARRAKATLRGGEVFARYGGEEFCLLCPRTPSTDAEEAAERIRVAAAAQPVQFESLQIPVTVSIGIASTSSPPHSDPQALLAEADHWLYVAKESGRNQIRLAGK